MSANQRKYSIDTRTLALTGLNIATSDASQNLTDFVRLDTLIDTSSIDESKKQNSKNTLINDFFRNCTLWSIVNINTNLTDALSTTLHAQYSNTTYVFKDESAKIDTKNNIPSS